MNILQLAVRIILIIYVQEMNMSVQKKMNYQKFPNLLVLFYILPYLPTTTYIKRILRVHYIKLFSNTSKK